MPDPYEDRPVSPIEASPVDCSPLPVSPVGRDQQQHDRRWSASIHGAVVDAEKQDWPPPPLPPIPPEREQDAWRKRSLKRCSYASQMSNYSMSQSFTTDAESKHRNNASTVSVTPSRNFSRPTTRRETQLLSTYLNWQAANCNPRNWSGRRKGFHTLAAALVAFVCTLASSIITPAHSTFERQFKVSPIIAILPFSLFVAGLSFGPILNRLCSENVGHKLVSVISMTIFALLTLGSAFIKSISGLLLCRALAGACVSPALDISMMMVFEIWPADARGLPFALYGAISFLGLSAGPVIGAYIIHAEDWRWAQYCILIAFAPCMALVICQRETHKNTLQRRRRTEKASQRWSIELRKVISRPFCVLFTRPGVFLFSVYGGCNFATLYVMFTACPRVFTKVYNANLASQGTASLGMLVGVVIGLVIMMLSNSLGGAELSRERTIESQEVFGAEHDKQRDSRVSLAPSRGTPSVLSRGGFSRNASRTSLPLVRFDPDAPRQDPEKNIDLAIAAAKYLNGRPGNESKRILPERVLLILDQTPTFSDVCSQLEAYALKFDRSVLAKVLVDSHPTATTTPDASEGCLARSKSLHRDATAASLGMPIPPPPIATLTTPTTRSEHGVWPLTAASSQVHLAPRPTPVLQGQRRRLLPKTAPARRNLWIGVLGSLLTTGSLFMFGWTTELKSAQILPIVAMGIFACGALLTFVLTVEFLMDSYGSTEGEYAMESSTIVRYALAAAFSIIAIPLFDSLSTAWATSVLGFINAGFALVPLSFLLFGKEIGKCGTHESAA